MSKVVKRVLEHVKGSELVGSVGCLRTSAGSKARRLPHMNKNLSLLLESYNPSLTKSDFCSLLGRDSNITGSFEVFKKRDPRYFQFRDQYYLKFDSVESLNMFIKDAKLRKLHKQRLHFIFSKGDLEKYSHNFKLYAQNLLAAYESSQKYFEVAESGQTTVSGLPTELTTLSALQEHLLPLEKASALVWNLPVDMTPSQVEQQFWLYDLRHCFRMYQNDQLPYKTLTFLSFENELECTRFKRNFHCMSLNVNQPASKLLVESLA